MKNPICLSLLGLAALAASLGAGSDDPRRAVQDAVSGAVSSTAPDALTDRPLDLRRVALLELAFASASKFPDGNHLQNRAAAQERVVEACLALDQPLRAIEYAARIDDWRRGTALAACAEHCARNGHEADARRCIEGAAAVARWSDEQLRLEWRRDRIRAGIARALTWLGDHELADRYQQGSVESETGRVQAVAVRVMDPEGFDVSLEAVEATLAVATLDQARSALEACVELFDRFYDDAGRRARVRAAVDRSLARVPLEVGIGVLLELAGRAAEHGDQAQALAIVDAAQASLDLEEWSAEHFVPMAARLARARSRAGQLEPARREADAALARYEAEKAEIPGIFRTETLLPLAEAYHAFGDDAEALAVYALAVAEGSANPNARPRADDLVAVCCSLARDGLAPDDALWQRMNAVSAGLAEPW